MNALEQMKARIPEAADGSRDALLNAYLDDATAYILNRTGQVALPVRLESAQVQLAVMLYNRQGIEGERSHTTGGVSRTLFGDEDVPASLRAQILAYRLAKVARRARV